MCQNFTVHNVVGVGDSGSSGNGQTDLLKFGKIAAVSVILPRQLEVGLVHTLVL